MKVDQLADRLSAAGMDVVRRPPLGRAGRSVSVGVTLACHLANKRAPDSETAIDIAIIEVVRVRATSVARQRLYIAVV